MSVLSRRKRAALRLARVGLVACFALGLAGCTVVKPWDRDMLSRNDMAWDPDPLEATRRGHIYFAKEATPVHGSGAGGGGCGCN